MKTVTINILNYNQKYFLPACIEAAFAQTYPYVEIQLIDNASEDGSVEFVRSRYPNIRIIENKKNRGYSAAHNIGISKASGDYILLLNTDLFMSPTYIERLVTSLKGKPDIGSATGKLLRSGFDPNAQPPYYSFNPPVIDSTGLFMDKQRRLTDRDAGKVDFGQRDSPEYVFAPCGAAPLYLRQMLEDITIDGEIFDESFFAYYEDGDLGWRAQLRGWKCLYLPSAIAYHIRGWSHTIGSQRNKQNGRQNSKQYSLNNQIHNQKNRYLMILKNERFPDILPDLTHILAVEVFRQGYLLFHSPGVLKWIPAFLRLLPEAWHKRKVIQANRRVAFSNRQWFVKNPILHWNHPGNLPASIFYGKEHKKTQ